MGRTDIHGSGGTDDAQRAGPSSAMGCTSPDRMNAIRAIGGRLVNEYFNRPVGHLPHPVTRVATP